MKWILLMIVLLGGTAAAQEDRIQTGDRLLIDKIRSDRNAGLPTLGMVMDQVEAAHGAPVSRAPAVGDPPITRWDYADFAVYFEHRTVIHAVAKRKIGSEGGS